MVLAREIEMKREKARASGRAVALARGLALDRGMAQVKPALFAVTGYRMARGRWD